MEKKIIVISGPSGSGKTTLYKRLLDEFKEYLGFSVSATTRNIRPNEENGRDYYFLTKEEFMRRVNNNEFIEWTEYCNNYYGTLKSEIERIKNSGKNCFLDLEVEGGMNIKKNYPDAILIFIIPPSEEELKRRLEKRGTNTEEEIKKRLMTALNELKFKDRYDYVIVNDDLERAYNELRNLLKKILNLN